MRKTLLICLLFLIYFRMEAQVKAVVELSKKSTLSVFVETNMMNFCLIQWGDQLLQAPIVVSPILQGNKLHIDKNKLDIEVRGFKSDNLIGQNEFYKLMQVSTFPRMSIELLSYESCTENKQKGQALLNITITDVTRQYIFPVTIGTSKDEIRINGRKQISISDFGLNPPRNLLLGLAKVNEQIDIGVNLICRVRLEGVLAERQP